MTTRTIGAVNKGALEARIPRFLLYRSLLFRAGLHHRRGVQAHIRFGDVPTAWRYVNVGQQTRSQCCRAVVPCPLHGHTGECPSFLPTFVWCRASFATVFDADQLFPPWVGALHSLHAADSACAGMAGWPAVPDHVRGQGGWRQSRHARSQLAVSTPTVSLSISLTWTRFPSTRQWMLIVLLTCDELGIAQPTLPRDIRVYGCHALKQPAPSFVGGRWKIRYANRMFHRRLPNIMQNKRSTDENNDMTVHSNLTIGYSNPTCD
jgi:hypothetical protein